MFERLSSGHMPPGHPPGPQSRRRKRMTRWGLMLMGGFAVFFAVLGIVGAAHPGKSTAAVFYGVFGGMALFTLGLGWLIYATSRPKRTRHFSVSAEPVQLRRGAKLSAQLQVASSSGTDGLEVGLVCTEFYDCDQITTNTNGGTYKRRVIRSVKAHEDWQKATPGQQTQTFTFELPNDGPFSHEGAVLSFAWEVCARVPRRGRRDPSSAQPIWVQP